MLRVGRCSCPGARPRAAAAPPQLAAPRSLALKNSCGARRNISGAAGLALRITCEAEGAPPAFAETTIVLDAQGTADFALSLNTRPGGQLARLRADSDGCLLSSSLFRLTGPLRRPLDARPRKTAPPRVS